MPQELDADAVRRWAELTAVRLRAHVDEINEMNVFPVADADTGTNLLTTAGGGLAAIAAAGDSVEEALRQWAQGAVLAARGNSGVILAQYLVGFAEGCRNGGDAASVAAGLRAGAARARTAVADPVPGTILSVADAAGEAESTALADLVATAVTLARAALRATTRQLAALARAGVVDAGGRGLVLVLEALAETVEGSGPATRHARVPSPVVHAPRPLAAGPGAAVASDPGDAEAADAAGAADAADYEVQYLLDADDDAIATLRGALLALGDSVAFAQAPDATWNVHVHVPTAAIGAVIEAGIRAGRPRRIEVSELAPTSAGAAVLALVPGGELADLFRAARARVLSLPERQSAGDLAAAIAECRSRDVVVLPNGMAPQELVSDAVHRAQPHGRRAIVVPTRSVVQGLAALAVHDPSRPLRDDVVAMAEAAAATRFAEVVEVEAESLTSVGLCQPGELVGLIDGDVVEIGHGLLSVGLSLLDRLLGVGAELITLVVGAGTPAGTAEALSRHVRERAPLTEVCVYAGGPAGHPLTIGAE